MADAASTKTSANAAMFQMERVFDFFVLDFFI
jgi:hypothetical protein